MSPRQVPLLGWRVRQSAGRATGQRGQATAEMAVAIVALVAALVPLLAGVQLILTAARAQEGARAIAREVSRGENGSSAVARVRSSLPGSAVSIQAEGGDAVVTVSVPLQLPFGPEMEVARTARTAQEPS